MEWVSVKDKLPIKGRMVLGFVDGDYEFICLRENKWSIFTDGSWRDLYAGSDVSHWTNLNHPEEA